MTPTVSVDGTEVMLVYRAQPEGPARGAVVVIHEAFGVNDHIERVCQRLSAEGYEAFAPHLFHRSGDPELAYDDIDAVLGHVRRLSASGLHEDVDATVGYLAASSRRGGPIEEPGGLVRPRPG